jgi:hypothetical protein
MAKGLAMGINKGHVLAKMKYLQILKKKGQGKE